MVWRENIARALGIMSVYIEIRDWRANVGAFVMSASLY